MGGLASWEASFEVVLVSWVVAGGWVAPGHAHVKSFSARGGCGGGTRATGKTVQQRGTILAVGSGRRGWAPGGQVHHFSKKIFPFL